MILLTIFSNLITFPLAYFSQAIAPNIFNPYYVNVPVLSNHIKEIFPETFILGGEIQKICFFFNLCNANVEPIDKENGNAGGTVIVIRSSNLNITTSS